MAQLCVGRGESGDRRLNFHDELVRWLGVLSEPFIKSGILFSRGTTRPNAEGRDEKKLPIILVACCGPKLDKPAPATDLYVSALFKKARTYAERRGRWFILSALHGLLDPATVIAPYDVTLKNMPAQKRREWGQKVREQMASAGLIELPLEALAGADYVKPLVDAGLRVAQPMKGLGIGKQLQWLTRENA